MSFRKYLSGLYPYSESSLNEKERHILKWQSLCVGGLQLDEMDTTGVLRLAEVLRSSYAAPTVNNMLRTLEQYYYYLIQQGYRQDHPIRNFRIRTDPKPILRHLLDESDLDTLYRDYSPKGHYRGQFDIYRGRNKAIVGLLIYQGLDSGSLRRLSVADLDMEAGRIHIPKISDYKLSERTLALEAVQIMGLYHYLQETRPALLRLIKIDPDTELLFPTSPHTKFSSLTKKIREQLGVSSLMLIRNSRIALWMKRYNLRQVQYMAGYRTLLSLEKFNGEQIEQLKQAIDKYHPM